MPPEGVIVADPLEPLAQDVDVVLIVITIGEGWLTLAVLILVHKF